MPEVREKVTKPPVQGEGDELVSTGRNVISVGCIVLHEDRVLLVKHNYGPTKGRWEFPRGRVEMTETMETAAVRELREETSIVAEPVRIIAVREQIGVDRASAYVHEVLSVWLMKHVANLPTPDGRELSDAAFMPVSEAVSAPDVSSWAKELIHVARATTGLNESAYLPSRLPDSIQSWKFYAAPYLLSPRQQ